MPVPARSDGRGALDVAVTVEQCWQPVPGGSGTYIVQLLTALRDDGDLRVRGLAAAHRHPAPADVRPPVPVTHAPLPRRALYDLWNHVGTPRAEHLLRGCDVVHATTWALPPTRRPLVVTVHDLAFLREPSHFTRRGVRFFRRALDRTRDEAAVVVVPSEATAVDCEAAGIERDRLVVVPHGIHPPATTSQDVTAFRRRHGLDAPYILWTGTREPRKNLTVLLKAFSRLAPALPDVHLVLVGPAGWGEDGLGAADPAVRQRIHSLGRLPRAELEAAYAGASVFCFPSLWEGFGLPVLEAMAHAVPVVTSAVSATAEVLGTAGALVDPRDPDDVAAAVVQALGPDGASWAEQGRQRSAAFTWTEAARRTGEVYRRAAG
jgi:glycosyltransferase involved in cell wall biosynthesis